MVPRGVTPTFILTFSEPELDLTTVDNVYVTFKGGKSITKSGDDLIVSASQIEVYLSQEETLGFIEGAVQIQVNWTYNDGSRAASNIVKYDFGPQLLNKVVS